MRTPRVDATIFGAASLLALAFGGAAAFTEHRPTADPLPASAGKTDALAGLWQSADNLVRLQLAADWSFFGTVEGRLQPARGTYQPAGEGLVLRDETGLHTPVAVAEHTLEMAGHQLFRA